MCRLQTPCPVPPPWQIRLRGQKPSLQGVLSCFRRSFWKTSCQAATAERGRPHRVTLGPETLVSRSARGPKRPWDTRPGTALATEHPGCVWTCLERLPRRPFTPACGMDRDQDESWGLGGLAH